jgi:hypothetical protein
VSVALWLLALQGVIGAFDYGAMIANLIPTLLAWWGQPTAILVAPPPIPEWLRWSLLAMAAGVLLSGLRDLYAALGLPHGAWPWRAVGSTSGRAGS